MSHFRCPLCGKQSSVKKYFPDTFEEGITVVEVKGLGRGRGFETVGEYSVEAFPDLLRRIKRRLVEINAMLGLYDQKTLRNLQKENQSLRKRLNQEYGKRVSLEEELEELDIEYQINRINQTTDESSESLDTAVDYLLKEYIKVSHEYDDLVDEYVEVLEFINEILPEVHPEYDSLEEALDALIQVYEDELEELEDSL